MDSRNQSSSSKDGLDNGTKGKRNGSRNPRPITRLAGGSMTEGNVQQISPNWEDGSPHQPPTRSSGAVIPEKQKQNCTVKIACDIYTMYKLRRYSLGDMRWDDMTDGDKKECWKKKRKEWEIKWKFLSAYVVDAKPHPMTGVSRREVKMLRKRWRNVGKAKRSEESEEKESW